MQLFGIVITTEEKLRERFKTMLSERETTQADFIKSLDRKNAQLVNRVLQLESELSEESGNKSQYTKGLEEGQRQLAAKVHTLEDQNFSLQKTVAIENMRRREDREFVYTAKKMLTTLSKLPNTPSRYLRDRAARWLANWEKANKLSNIKKAVKNADSI